jgi:LPS export ABC transporter protein LptC
MKKYKFCMVAILIGLATMFISCENDIEVIKKITNPNVLPELTGTNVEIWYSDSAKLKVKIVTPQLDRYLKEAQKTYIEFPKGIHVYFYNDSMQVHAEISSRYAIYKESEKLWEARNDVVVINTKGEKLNTEQLFWDEVKEKIYSTSYSRITTPDGENIGEKGFEAKQDFTEWRLNRSRGKVKFRDETSMIQDSQ